MTQPIGAVPGYSYRNDKLQLSSTDNKIKSFVKTAFEKISTFFATCYNYCKTKYAALKAKITFYFKKSAPTASEEFQQTAERLSRFPGQARQEDQKHGAAQQTVRFSTPEILTSEILTPETGALVPYTGPQTGSQEAAGNSTRDQDHMDSMRALSLRMLIDNNFELPTNLAPFISIRFSQNNFESLTAPLPSANASQPEIPVAINPSVEAGQVLAPHMEFAIRQNQPNTSPDANVDQSSGSNVAAYMFGAGTAFIAGAAVLKNDPELFTRLASGAAQCARPVLAKALSAATNGAQTVADALKSAVANAGNKGRVEIDIL